MAHQIPAPHTQGIERADHAAFRLDGVDHKDRNHIAQQRHNDHARGNAGIFVDDHVVRSPADAGVVLCRREATQVGQIRLQIPVCDLRDRILQRLCAVCQLAAGSLQRIDGLQQLPGQHELEREKGILVYAVVQLRQSVAERPVSVGQLRRAGEQLVPLGPKLLPIRLKPGIVHLGRVKAQRLQMRPKRRVGRLAAQPVGINVLLRLQGQVGLLKLVIRRVCHKGGAEVGAVHRAVAHRAKRRVIVRRGHDGADRQGLPGQRDPVFHVQTVCLAKALFQRDLIFAVG